MQKRLTYSYIGLVILTIIGAMLSKLPFNSLIVITIVLISVSKFLLVGFEFMNLKKAHPFWKGIFIVYSLVIGGLFVLFLR
jgi:hypothetical protein